MPMIFFRIIAAVTAISSMITQMPLLLYNHETTEYKDMSANPVILDLDFCSDVDDVLAVRMATILDKKHVCSLKAVGLTTSSKEKDLEIKAIHGLLSYDGYDDIPIGKDVLNYSEEDSRYWQTLAEYSTSEPVTDDAVVIYKNVLKQCYNDVTIITTGYLTNVAKLLQDKEGYQLVQNNCKRLVVMGGSLENGWENNFSYHKDAITATKYVLEHCPCEILFIPQDFAAKIQIGDVLQTNYPDDPVSKALYAWGTENGRTAWDPYTTLIGCLPDGAISLIYENVITHIYSSGEVYFENTNEKTNKILVKQNPAITNEQYKELIDGIINLT